MKKHTKILSFILAVIMIISAIPMTASAEGIYGDLTYTVSNGKVEITDCNTSATEVVIPDEINDYPVTSIGYWAFYNCSSLTSVTIPDSVENIFRAFENCDSLTSITVDVNNNNYSSDEYGVLFNKDKTTLIQYPVGNIRTSYIIPDGVEIISYFAFWGCSALTDIIFPDSVINIGNQAFSYCKSLKNVTIPDSVTSIGKVAFWYCESLESVTIGESVSFMDEGAFRYCDSLTSITVDTNNNYYSSDKYGVLFNKDKTDLIQYPAGNTRISYVIPNSVTSIGTDAFENCKSLTNIIISDGVTNIGDYAFDYCTSLASIEIPDSVTNIGNSAFNACHSLTNIEIPDSVTSIGDWAFENCSSLTSITINNPNGKIYDSKYTIYSKTIIYGYCGSTAQAYAEKYNRNFRCLESVAEITQQTCTEQGFTTYTCPVCGDSYVDDYVEAIGHIDADNDTICDLCDFVFEMNNEDESNKDNETDKDNTTDNDNEKKCFCACHSDNSFVSFIYKIVRFLRTLFGLNYCRNCACPYI